MSVMISCPACFRYYPRGGRKKHNRDTSHTTQKSISAKKQIEERCPQIHSERTDYVVNLSSFQKMITNVKTQEVGNAESLEIVSDVDSLNDSDSDAGTDSNGDVEILDEENSSPSKAGTRSYKWPKRRRSGWPVCALETERKLCLPGFTVSLRRYFENSADGRSSFEPDPLIHVYDSVRMEYPSWIGDEVAVESVTNTKFKSTKNYQRLPKEYILPSRGAMIAKQIKSAPRGCKAL
jgi:hypothetical protein